MSVKEEGRELMLCRICLATDTELYNIRASNLLDVFVGLMGTEHEWSKQGLCVCAVCRAQLARAGALRARARRAEVLLDTALKQTHCVTFDYIRTIDRVAEKLCLNLRTCAVYTTDSTLQEIKEEIKEESDFTENIFVSEPSIADYEDFRENTPEFNSIEEITDQENTKCNSNEIITNKIEFRKINKQSDTKIRKLPKTTKVTKRKLPDSTKGIIESTNLKPDSTKEILPVKKKRVVKRRMADNGFLPDFNFEEFENKYNVKIDILSKEEQMREIEARKSAPSYMLASFGCEVCGKGFATKQVFDAHMMKHDVSAGGHACAVCGVRFGTRSRAHVHADAHRLRFTCNACGFLTRTRFIAKNHYLSHSGKTHQCPHCDAAFTKYTSYLTHVRRRHPAMNVACDECGETFVGHNGLRHHKTRVHRNTQLKPRAEVPCRDCSQTFIDQASYDTHYQRIHLNIRMKEPPRARSRNARAFICELCGAECSSVSSLSAHQLAHGGARPHGCPAPGCARRFATLHNMQRHHRVVHLGTRPQVACGVCGKLLAHAASLKLHVSTVHLKLPAPRRRRDKHDVRVQT